MVKSAKEKSAIEALSIFHNIIAASVKGNPKQIDKKVVNKKKINE